MELVQNSNRESARVNGSRARTMATVFIYLTHEWLKWKMILNHYRGPSGLLIFKFFQAAVIITEWFANFAPASGFFVRLWTSFLSLSFTMFLLLHNDKLKEYCEPLSCRILWPFQGWRAFLRRFQWLNRDTLIFKNGNMILYWLNVS